MPQSARISQQQQEAINQWTAKVAVSAAAVRQAQIEAEAQEEQEDLVAENENEAKLLNAIKVVVPLPAASAATPDPQKLVEVAKQTRTLNEAVGRPQPAANFTDPKIRESLTEVRRLHVAAGLEYDNYSGGWLVATLAPGIIGSVACAVIASGPVGWLVSAAVLTALVGAYCINRYVRNTAAFFKLKNTDQHMTTLEKRCLSAESKGDEPFFIDLRKLLIKLGELRTIKSLRCLNAIEKILETYVNDGSRNISQLHEDIVSKIDGFISPSKNKALRFFNEDAGFNKACLESDFYKTKPSADLLEYRPR